MGTSGAENQGGVSIPRPQLTPLSLFGTSLLCLKEVPRQSRSSLPLKVSATVGTQTQGDRLLVMLGMN